MSYLIDENVPARVVRALDEAGFSITSASTILHGSPDEELCQFAMKSGLVIITQDHDFSTLVIRDLWQVPGLILVEMPRSTAVEIATRLLDVLQDHGDQAPGNIVVVEPSRIRVRALPKPEV